MAPTLEDCIALDATDPLRDRRALFELPAGVLYLDGNSLGALPRSVRPRLAQTVDEHWGRDLIRSWNTAGWIDLPSRVGARIAPLLGAHPDEVIAADSTSVNLFKLAAAAVRLRPGRRVILSEPGNFPTDLYVMQGLAELLGDRVELRLVERERIAEALDEGVALLLLTHVHYKTGRVHDMAALSKRAHDVGALTLWDLSHSAGALELALDRDGADLAVGCGYKYLNGGPGAPAFLFVARALHDTLRNPLSGWMGHAQPFTFTDTYAPAKGLLRTLCGTPSVLGLTALDAALEVFDGVSMGALREKSKRLGALFLELVASRCSSHGLTPACPTEPNERGSQVSLHSPDGYPIMQALIARGVIGDFRAPDVLRFGFAPLYVGYADVWNSVEHLRVVLDEGLWRDERYRRVAAVT